MAKWILALSLFVIPSLDDPLRVRVSPGVALAPAAIRVVATVRPHEANRALTVTVESDTYRQSQRVSIEGAEPRRTFIVRFSDIPEGDYAIRATLKRNDGTSSRAVASLRVTAEESTRVALPMRPGGAS